MLDLKAGRRVRRQRMHGSGVGTEATIGLKISQAFLQRSTPPATPSTGGLAFQQPRASNEDSYVGLLE
jgi:hypothetical protein